MTRQKLPSDWHKRVQAIQAKITEALKDLPAGTMAQLPGGQDAPMDYFRAVQIRDKLAETGERTLFGGLSGQASIWDKIVKAYENGGKLILCACGAAVIAVATAALTAVALHEESALQASSPAVCL